MIGLLGARGELAAAADSDFKEFGRAQEQWERLFTLSAGQLRRRLAHSRENLALGA